MDDFTRGLPDQTGRLMIVTGANTGLGFETTRMLAEKGATVVMACRNLQKAEAARARIAEAVPDASLEVLEIDLASMSSVRAFADAFLARHDRLDVLINNAGVMMPPFTKTEDGFELQFAANYLGHFLLTARLMDVIRATEGSRVVSLSSIAHRRGRIDFDDLQSEDGYSASDAYAQSKLACLLFAYELQRRLEAVGDDTTISTAAHPGVATTELARHLPSLLYTVARYTIAPFLTHSAEAGARPTMLAAIGEAGGGDYFGPTGFKEMKGAPGHASSTRQARDEDLARRLWEVSEELVGERMLAG